MWSWLTNLSHIYSDVAKISSLSGLKGRLLLKASNSLFYVLEAGDTLYFVPPQLDAPRSSIISEIEFAEDSAKVAFADVDSVDTASLLIGCTCLIEDAKLLDRVGEDASSAAIIEVGKDWILEDLTSNRAFIVQEVQDYPSQKMLVITAEEDLPDDEHVHLVPLANDLVVGIDESARKLTMLLPQGIFDL